MTELHTQHKINKNKIQLTNTVRPRSNGPSYVITYYFKWVTTLWTYSFFGWGFLCFFLGIFMGLFTLNFFSLSLFPISGGFFMFWFLFFWLGFLVPILLEIIHLFKYIFSNKIMSSLCVLNNELQSRNIKVCNCSINRLVSRVGSIIVKQTNHVVQVQGNQVTRVQVHVPLRLREGRFDSSGSFSKGKLL